MAENPEKVFLKNTEHEKALSALLDMLKNSPKIDCTKAISRKNGEYFKEIVELDVIDLAWVGTDGLMTKYQTLGVSGQVNYGNESPRQFSAESIVVQIAKISGKLKRAPDSLLFFQYSSDNSGFKEAFDFSEIEQPILDAIYDLSPQFSGMSLLDIGDYLNP